MRRLYSTFAGGWPGIGLVLMRLVTAIALLTGARAVLTNDAISLHEFMTVFLVSAAILLSLGLCTPIVGTLLALVEASTIAVRPSEWLLHVLVATFGAALAMLGPGLWSIDARLFGWKRIEPSPRKS